MKIWNPIPLILFVSMTCLPLYCSSQERILTMSTTTSTQASGLLDTILPVFTEETGITVHVIAKGTGAALRDGMDGNVDIVFVHAKSREEAFVGQGYGTKRYSVMHNDFVILGPKKDPAAIHGSHNAAMALKKIATSHSLFISRGDDSGTHTKEQLLWKKSGVPLISLDRSVAPKNQARKISVVLPKDSDGWYLSIGQGMGKVLTFADEKQAYTLADRGTYIKYRYGRQVPLDLVVLCQDDPLLANPYGVIPVNPKKYPHVQYQLARQFVDWIISPRGQQLIADYRLLGKQLFYPDRL